jgi:hypothetical protein
LLVRQGSPQQVVLWMLNRDCTPQVRNAFVTEAALLRGLGTHANVIG